MQLSCRNKSDTEAAIEQLTRGKDIEKLYILTSNGCLSCNIKFSEYILKVSDDPHSLIVINAAPYRINLSHYKNRPGVLFNRYRELPFFNDSKIVYLTGIQIDSVIPVKVETMGWFER
jgi:hypothetical protein